MCIVCISEATSLAAVAVSATPRTMSWARQHIGITMTPKMPSSWGIFLLVLAISYLLLEYIGG